MPVDLGYSRDVSIHALREEGDGIVEVDTDLGKVSIHALREEGDSKFKETLSEQFEFLSTPSVRRATQIAVPADHREVVSIHALREEGD